jgi:hypothetical protein
MRVRSPCRAASAVEGFVLISAGSARFLSNWSAFTARYRHVQSLWRSGRRELSNRQPASRGLFRMLSGKERRSGSGLV